MKFWPMLLLLVACEGPVAPPKPIPPPVPDVPPRVDVPFTWEGAAIFSSFALRDKSPGHIKEIYAQARDYGFNTARVCAETEFWDGDLPTQVRDENALEAFLGHVATIPGAQVLLVGNCTLKGPVAFEEQDGWNTKVVGIASRYKNVAYEAINEFRECRHRGWGPYCVDGGHVKGWIREAQAAGLQAGADDSFCGGGIFRHELSDVISFASFHPCREDERGEPWDPAQGTLQRLVSANRGLIVLSETVCYDENSSGGLYTSDNKRVQDYLDRCKATPGCVWTYHYSQGLTSDLAPWFPNW